MNGLVFRGRSTRKENYNCSMSVVLVHPGHQVYAGWRKVLLALQTSCARNIVRYRGANDPGSDLKLLRRHCLDVLLATLVV